MAYNTGVTFIEKNSVYTRYDVKDSNLFSFLLYLPKSIILLSGYENIFDTGFILESQPILIDDSSYKKPIRIDEKYTSPNTSGQDIFIKTAQGNSFSYYIKLSNINAKQNVLLQLNRTFSVNWKVSSISKSTYDSILCEQETYYPISNNTFCYSDKRFSTLQDFFHVFFSKNYTNIDHFE